MRQVGIDAARPSVDGHARRTIGRYAIDGILGRGGASTVYAATDLLLGREVALKIFTARADSTEHLREQEAEARLVARLNHPGLTTLLDAGVEVDDGGPAQLFLVMERIAGPDLRHRLRSGPLTPLQVAYLGFDLALGLQHMHEAGYLHRDIKPANVLIDERSDVRIRGKLTDFGISSLIGTHQGEFTTGTAAYLGPEQVEGLDATAATDTYSLGIVLLEACTARVAFPGTITGSALARLDRSPEIPDTIPAALAEVVRAMTARAPGDRPGLSVVVAALQAFIAAELAASAAPTPPQGDAPATVIRADLGAEGPDAIMDQIAHLARRLLGGDSAAVLANDRTGLLARSVVGGHWPPHIPLADPFTALIVGLITGHRAPSAILDVTDDVRIASSGLTAGWPVRSLAVAPMIDADSNAVGAIVVTTTAPRRYDADQLEDLGRLAAVLIHDYDIRLAARRALFRA